MRLGLSHTRGTTVRAETPGGWDALGPPAAEAGNGWRGRFPPEEVQRQGPRTRAEFGPLRPYGACRIVRLADNIGLSHRERWSLKRGWRRAPQPIGHAEGARAWGDVKADGARRVDSALESMGTGGRSETDGGQHSTRHPWRTPTRVGPSRGVLAHVSGVCFIRGLCMVSPAFTRRRETCGSACV